MQAARLSEADEYRLKQRNKIEISFSLLKEKYTLATSKARSISGYLAEIYASLSAYRLCHQNKSTIHICDQFT